MRTVFCLLYVVISMILLAPLGFMVTVFSLLGLRRPMSRLMYMVAQIWARLLLMIAGCTVSAFGTENVPSKAGVCFVSNHGSYFDIVLLLAYAGRPIGFVAKKELLFIPLLNMWIFILGGLFIDRKNVRKALRTINKGVEQIKTGQGMIIFPEGHRSRGQGLLPFHPGSLKLATQAEAQIIPVAISGTYNLWEEYHRVIPVPATIRFGMPINTAEIPKTDRKQILSDKVFAVIREMLKS